MKYRTLSHNFSIECSFLKKNECLVSSFAIMSSKISSKLALFCTFSLQKTNHRNYKTFSNKRPLLKIPLEDPPKRSRKKIVDRSTIGVRTVCCSSIPESFNNVVQGGEGEVVGQLRCIYETITTKI